MAHRHVYGWWAFDDAESTLVSNDGARVRFVGPVSDDNALGLRNTGNRRWMRFEARSERHTGAAYPLLVERRDVLDPLLPSQRRLVWRLDHIRSAQLRGERPDPVLWQAVDRLAIDGLYCWPHGSRAGLRPSEVAVSGGWRGGEWTGDYYRTFSGSGIDAYPGDGPFPDPPPEAPQRWQMIVPARPASIEDAQAQFEALRSTARNELASLLPALTGSRPHLRSPRGELLIPLFTSSVSQPVFRWLYVDETLITDRLQCTIWSAAPTFAPEWKFWMTHGGCLVGTIDRRAGTYFDFRAHSRGYAERTSRQGALFVEVGHFPSAVLARFREVVSDAVWSWRDTSCVLPGEDGRAAEVRLIAAAQTEIWPATQYGGWERATTMRAAPRLQHEGRGIRLAAMFADDDGYAPRVRTARVGRFDFDGATLAMSDRETGQELGFERTLDGSPEASSDQLAVFSYRDADTRYPIVVRRPARHDPDAAAEWVLDHAASAERWRGTAAADSSTAALPPQELWQRIARFAFEALLVWPDTAASGPAPRAVVAAGGWWAGRWTSDVRRRESTRVVTDVSWKHIREQSLHKNFAALFAEDPRVIVSGPADPEPTLVWKAHASMTEAQRRRDAARAFGPTTPEITIDAPGAISVDPVNLGAFAAERLAGRHYWLRADAGALLYVCGEHKVMRGGPEPTEVMEPLFEYADADVRLRLQLSFTSGLDQPLSLVTVLWPRVVRGSRFHEQDGVVPDGLFLPVPGAKDSWRPHARLWHRLADAAEALLDPVRTGNREGIAVRGLYVGGAFDTGGERRTWFEG